MGHRNNQIHVYDEIGVEFREHHYTRRIMEGTIGFWPEEYVPEFRPRSAFAGELPCSWVPWGVATRWPTTRASTRP